MPIDPSIYFKYGQMVPTNRYTGPLNALTTQYDASRRRSAEDEARARQAELDRVAGEERERRRLQEDFAMQQAQMGAARTQAMHNALQRVSAPPSAAQFGNLDRSGATSQYDYAKRELMPFMSPDQALALNTPQTPEYQIIDGQYVPKNPGGAAMPIPGFEQDQTKALDAGYRTFLKANNAVPSPESYRAWQNSEERLKKAGATQVNLGEGQKGFENATTLRKEFAASPEVKTWGEISVQVGRLGEAMKELGAMKPTDSKVAIDQSLITIFNKMLDPASVVRESEYARTSQDISLLNRLKGKWDKIQSGGAGLTDEERRAMFNLSRKFAHVARKKYDKHKEYYSGVAKRNSIRVDDVVTPEETVDYSDLSKLSNEELLRGL